MRFFLYCFLLLNVTVFENTRIVVSDSCKRNREYRRVGNGDGDDDDDDGIVDDDDDLVRCACDSSRQQRGQRSLRYKALERKLSPFVSFFSFASESHSYELEWGALWVWMEVGPLAVHYFGISKTTRLEVFV